MTELSFYLSDDHHQAQVLPFIRPPIVELQKDFRVCADLKPRYTTGHSEVYIPAGSTTADLDKIFGSKTKNEPVQKPNNVFAFNMNYIKSPACY